MYSTEQANGGGGGDRKGWVDESKSNDPDENRLWKSGSTIETRCAAEGDVAAAEMFSSRCTQTLQ